MGRHKVDHRRGGKLGRTNQITFVFAVFIIDNNNDPTVSEIIKGFRHTIKGCCHSAIIHNT